MGMRHHASLQIVAEGGCAAAEERQFERLDK